MFVIIKLFVLSGIFTRSCQFWWGPTVRLVLCPAKVGSIIYLPAFGELADTCVIGNFGGRQRKKRLITNVNLLFCDVEVWATLHTVKISHARVRKLHASRTRLGRDIWWEIFNQHRASYPSASFSGKKVCLRPKPALLCIN